MNVGQIRILLILFFIITIESFVYSQRKEDYLSLLGKRKELFSKVLNENKEIFIQLPQSYHIEAYRNYPVVLIIDGEVLLPLVQIIQSFYSGGYTPEMILVGISNKKHRTRDLTPSEININSNNAINKIGGGAKKYSNFLIKELIPYLDKNYRTTNYRTLIGHSYGGLFAIHMLLENATIFRNYIAVDPSLDWDNQFILKEAKKKDSLLKLRDVNLYISLGGQLHMQDKSVTLKNVMEDESDFTLFSRSNIRFSNYIRNSAQWDGSKFQWEFFEKEIHGTIAFPSIKNSLIKMFSWFQMENTEKFNSPQLSKDELIELIEFRANKLYENFGYETPAYPLDLLIMLGRMSLDINQPNKSKMFLEYALKYYPRNSIPYREMSFFYERIGEYKNAISNIKEAYSISKSKEDASRLDELKMKHK